jgi:hypothetical protein
MSSYPCTSTALAFQQAGAKAQTQPSTPLAPVPAAGQPRAKIHISPFYGYGRHVWAIYPDYWPESWGRPPLFGYVSADDKFCAERVAFDAGIVPDNDTFRPRPVKSFPRRPEGQAAPATARE